MSSILPLLEQAEDPKLLDALSRIGPAIVPQEKFNVFPIPYRSHVLVNPKSSYDADLTLSWLNSGVEKVIVPISWTKSLATLVPRERVVLFLDVSNISAVTDTVRNSVSGVLLKVSSYDLDLIRSIAQFFSGSEVYVLASEGVVPTIANVRELSTIPATLVLSSRYLTLGATTRTQINVGDAYAVRLVSDRPDGLFPTVVSNESGHTLGLVYSSAESVRESIVSGRGTYFSRKHGLWRKGETSGATQDVISVYLDCDSDALNYRVVQHGTGFCHLQRFSCFHEATGLFGLEKILQSRLQNAPAGSYTQRLFNDSNLLKSKIMEEADELSRAETPEEIAFEAADLIYFALVKCTSAGVSIADIERSLDAKAKKITRRPGDAKSQWSAPATTAAPAAQKAVDPSTPISMRTVDLSTIPLSEQPALLKRPILNSSAMLAKVQPIVDDVRIRGDTALLELTAKFDKAQLATPILLPPFSPASMQLDYSVKTAIDRAYANIRLFHEAQNDTETLVVQTMPGVVCSRFARPIERVGLYVPGGTAILPSTALMLGIPAQVAGCETIVLATPPRADGSITPEVVYVAYLVGASAILKAGGAQAIAAMAYGTESVPKVDKIFGPGNQWVTAAKMLVQNDTEALVSIDMPAGPSEVLVRPSPPPPPPPRLCFPCARVILAVQQN